MQVVRGVLRAAFLLEAGMAMVVKGGRAPRVMRAAARALTVKRQKKFLEVLAGTCNVTAAAKAAWGASFGSRVTVRDEGERPVRLRGLVGQAEAAVAALPSQLGGWQVVTLQFLRTRLVKEPRGAASTGSGQGWAGVIEYRARMLSG